MVRLTLKCLRDMRRTYNQVHSFDKSSQLSLIIWRVSINGLFFFLKQVTVGSSQIPLIETSDFALLLSKEFVDIQATIKCGWIHKEIRT